MKQREFSALDITSRAVQGVTLSREEIKFLLSLTDSKDINTLFDAAAAVRRRYFGNSVFLYGFVYFTTYCRNNCTFCCFRRDNQDCVRYRKSNSEIGDAAVELANSGVHVIDLTMGEDPHIHDEGNYSALYDVVSTVKERTDCYVMVSPGVVPKKVLQQIKTRGADWYACYQETHNPKLFRRLRVGQSYKERTDARRWARAAGLLVEDGILLGVGESIDNRVASIVTFKASKAKQVRVMTLVPQPGTPFAGYYSIPNIDELVMIATMRLIMPDRLIPASLDIEGIKGLMVRLRAGANVVTSLIPPTREFVGVCQPTLDVDDGGRTVAAVSPILEKLGLCVASPSEYRRFVDFHRSKTADGEAL